jgi:crotonobetainyl-CoA:carnitine CoA-transferase CaiB-like acyl-CoA transferase
MKLEGVKVVDLSVFLPGPYLTMALADHGAEVIKVEPPGEGDPGRHIGLSDGPSTVFFRNVNRGKKSALIDLKTPQGREALLQLCDTADVFVESFRPGVMQRLGVDYATVSARNPRIVYCSISAFGQDGPYRDRPAHDLATMALAGAIGLTLGRDGAPAIPGVAVADIVSSLQALSGVLMALYRRDRTGRGDYIDVAMQHAALAALPNVMGAAMSGQPQPNPKHERSTGGSAFYQVYETADGRHLVLGAQELKFVRTLLERLCHSDLVPLCEQGPGPHQAPVIAFLQGIFREKPLADWRIWFEGMDVSFAPVNTLREAIDDPNVRARGLILKDDLGREHIAPVVRYLDEPAQPSLREPELGEHNRAIERALIVPIELLDPDDVAVVAACLQASDEGPFFPDWEFQTLFGVERSELRRVRMRWPNVSLTEETVYVSVMNSVCHLLVYPHGEEEALLRYVPEGRDRIQRLGHKLNARLS